MGFGEVILTPSPFHYKPILCLYDQEIFQAGVLDSEQPMLSHDFHLYHLFIEARTKNCDLENALVGLVLLYRSESFIISAIHLSCQIEM